MSASGASLDAVVVGAGITGLTAAFRLARAGARVAVVEAGDRIGGAIETWRDDGWLFELGPNTVLDNQPAVGELIADAGLGDERLAAEPAGKRRYLWKGDRLVPLPSGPPGFLTTPLFPLGAKLRLLREPWIAPVPAAEDGGREESIADFVRRRLGQDLLDYAVGPFVSGVYAGDPERLSVRWAVRKIWALEQEHGSLIRGALAKRKGPAPGGAMISFHNGLETLPRRLAAAIGEGGDGGSGLYLHTPCHRVVHDAGGFKIEAEGFALAADRVVLAVPADAAAELLADATGGDSRIFAEVPYAPVAVVSLGFRRDDVAHPLDGFGFLAPRKESLRLLGCLFPSSLFPGRAPAGHVALSAFAGGRTDPEVVGWDDRRLLELVTGELRQALGLRGDPVAARVRRWPRAIPQYEIGHGRFVELARRIEADLPGLAVAGNFTGGAAAERIGSLALHLGDALGRAEELRRIDAGAAPAYPEVEVGTGDPAGRADPAHRLAGADLLARLDFDLLEVEEHGDQSVAVVEEDAVAGEEVLGGEDHGAGGGSEDRGAGGRLVVGAAVRALGLAVDHPPRPEAAAGGERRERRLERQAEPPRRPPAPQLADLSVLARHPSEVSRRQVHLAVVLDGDALLGVRVAADLDRRRPPHSVRPALEGQRPRPPQQVDRVPAHAVDGAPALTLQAAALGPGPAPPHHPAGDHRLRVTGAGLGRCGGEHGSQSQGGGQRHEPPPRRPHGRACYPASDESRSGRRPMKARRYNPPRPADRPPPGPRPCPAAPRPTSREPPAGGPSYHDPDPGHRRRRTGWLRAGAGAARALRP